jgi:hypothetical protein
LEHELPEFVDVPDFLGAGSTDNKMVLIIISIDNQATDFIGAGPTG